MLVPSAYKGLLMDNYGKYETSIVATGHHCQKATSHTLALLIIWL